MARNREAIGSGIHHTPMSEDMTPFDRRAPLRAFASIWAEHTRSYQPDVLYNEVHPKTVIPVLIGATALILGMYLVPHVRRFSGFDHPWIPIVLLHVGSLVSLTQWRYWKRQSVVHVLLLIDNCLYCLAIVAVMIDSVSPVRYVWGLLYGQMAAYYGRRYAFSWPLLISISAIPFGTTVYFCHDDYGLLALTLFGALIFVVSATTTRRAREIERQKERYQNAYQITDQVATESLDIAIAMSMAEVGNFLHELRSATAPIIGNLMILKEHEELHTDIKESVESLHWSYTRTKELTDKLLTSIKRRSIPGNTTFAVSDIIDSEVLCAGLMPRDRNKICLKGKVPQFVIRGRPDHLTAVIENLLHNAINAGATLVTVSASLDGSLKRVIITVSDNGPGIPEDSRDGILELASGSHRYSSHGLGLPLSKRLIELFGGGIRLAHTGSGGTTFEIAVTGRMGHPDAP